MQLFVDMDGVLADFDRHHEAVFGFRSDKILDNVDWTAVRDCPGFYRNIPPMRDLGLLWAGIGHLKPIVLTGIPSDVPEAADNKKAWVAHNISPDVPVICCQSKNKYKYCRRGDILIDDWEKYKLKWIYAGGIWITHISATETLNQLTEILHGTS